MNTQPLAAYFTHVESRFKAGKLSPLSPEGGEVLNQLLDAIERLKARQADLELAARRPSDTGRDFDAFLDVVDLRMRLCLLLGEWWGFTKGVNFVIAKAGSQSQYFL